MSDAVLRATVPIPPSNNRIWKPSVQKVHGRFVPIMHLTTEAKRYKEVVKAQLLEDCRDEIMVMDTEAAYELALTLYTAVLNASWGKDPRTKTRFKDLDNSNRIILLENAVKMATGVNDNHHFRLVVEKRQVWDNQEEGVLIELTPLPEGWWLE